MSNPYPGITVNFGTQNFGISYLDPTNTVISKNNRYIPITNYEYEVGLNEDKRKILILKPEYLSAFISDMRNIMKYSPSSQYIDENTLGTTNPRITGS
jgi:hypothetical protein